MPSVGLVPTLALVTGAVGGLLLPLPVLFAAPLLPLTGVAALCAWRAHRPHLTLLLVTAGFLTGGAVLATEAADAALRSPLRQLLDRHLGGFTIERLGPAREYDPVRSRAMLVEDAAVREGFVALRVRVTHVQLQGKWLPAEGGVPLSVSGEAGSAASDAWRAGRTIEAPVSYRRPARYLNEGVPDFERDAALGGATLFGSIKSALVIELVGRGSALAEAAAHLRAHVREAIARWVGPHNGIAAAVVTAVLIGDRTGLPAVVRDRLQAAGTYHVIAISGGNSAILAGVVVGVLMVAGIRGRAAALIAIAVLLVYSEVATAGPSVWRATLMAVLYFGARLLDHRPAAWQTAAMAAAVMVIVNPLDVRDPGFVLTFGATAALLEAARRGRAWLPRRRPVAWLAASVVASLATEIALLPVSAEAFSRVTSAGLLLNLIAVPMMGLAQVMGLVVVVFSPIETVASAAGWCAYAAAHTLVETSKLVDVAPWLTRRVPSPGLLLVVLYYLSLAIALGARGRLRFVGGAGLLASVLMMTVAPPVTWAAPRPPAHVLRWDVFDVGQAEAMLLQLNRSTLQIDTGGRPFGTSSFDVGARVLAPALWARGVRRLDTLLITHGDPDHVGGAMPILQAFRPRAWWEGIEVPTHVPTRELRGAARARGSQVRVRRAGESFDWQGARIRVLHPPEPDWERPRVRNDDSVVLEVVYRDVALLLTGDTGSDVERAIAPHLTHAPVRILKVAHHGSRTSSSRALLETWRPQYAVISAGRGNTFGHPAPDILRRLEAIGATVFRTDVHGQVTVMTDGEDVEIRTYWPPGTPSRSH